MIAVDIPRTPGPVASSIAAHVIRPEDDPTELTHGIWRQEDPDFVRGVPGYLIEALCGYRFVTSDRDPADLAPCRVCISMAEVLDNYRHDLLMAVVRRPDLVAQVRNQGEARDG